MRFWEMSSVSSRRKLRSCEPVARSWLPSEVTATAVAVVVLNWNGGDDTIECLAWLSRVTSPLIDVIVVDNGCGHP